MEAPAVIRELPPAALVEPCRDPYVDVETVAQLVDQLVDTRAALAECAEKVDRLREWRGALSS